MKTHTSERTESEGLTQRGSKIAHDLMDHAHDVADRGKKRSDKLVGGRRRNMLLRELGTVIYDAHLAGDDTLDVGKRDGLLADLDDLQSPVAAPLTI